MEVRFSLSIYSLNYKKIIIARDYCAVETIVSEGDYNISTVNDGRKKVRGP
jgi:hypothetical protein